MHIFETNPQYKRLKPKHSSTGWYRVSDGDNLLYYGQSRFVAELLMNVMNLPKK